MEFRLTLVPVPQIEPDTCFLGCFEFFFQLVFQSFRQLRMLLKLPALGKIADDLFNVFPVLFAQWGFLSSFQHLFCELDRFEFNGEVQRIRKIFGVFRDKEFLALKGKPEVFDVFSEGFPDGF